MGIHVHVQVIICHIYTYNMHIYTRKQALAHTTQHTHTALKKGGFFKEDFWPLVSTSIHYVYFGKHI